MRAHFSLLYIEGDNYDRVNLYDNQSNNYYTHGASGSDIIYTTDRWTIWHETDMISFNLTSDSFSVELDGYIVDKYQLSAISPSEFNTSAIRMNTSIHWNYYKFNHTLGQDNLTLTAPAGTTFMRINFTHVSYELGRDYLVLFDNESNWLMDYTGDHFNLVTPWFCTDSITISYVSDDKSVTDEDLNIAALIDHVDWTNSTDLNFTSRIDEWTFNYDYDTVDGRARGYGAERDGEIGMAVEIQGVNETSYGDYCYKKFSYEASDKSEFYQVIPISRGRVIDGYFSLDYYGEKLIMSNDFELYVAINDTIIYPKGFTTINQNPRTWQSTGKIWLPLWANSSNLFDDIGNNSFIKFAVGIRFNHDSAITFTNFDNSDRQVLVLDDIELVLTTQANATQSDIDLRINGTAVNDTAGATWGQAEFNAVGNWTSNPLNLIFSTASPSLEFDVDLILNAKTEFNSTYLQDFDKEGARFSVQEADNVTWAFYLNIYIPMSYQNYRFSVWIPSSWVVDDVKDPTGISVPFQGGALNDGYFQASPSSQGWFLVNAHSSNLLNDTLFSTDNQTWTGNMSFTNQERVYFSSTFSRILDLIPGNASIQIYSPNGTLWYEQYNKTTNSAYNVSFGPIDFASNNATGGLYNGCIGWQNQTEAGFINFVINNTHASELSLVYPVDAVADNITDQLVESVIPIRVTYNDTFTGKLIPGANVVGTLNCSPAINFTLIESANGIYDHALDVAGIPEGYYKVVINASKAGYNDASLTLYINLNVETRIENFISYHETEQGLNVSITFHYHDVNRDVGISGATINVSFSSSNYSINEAGGNYTILLNTSDLNIGSHPYTINVSKAYHETQTLNGIINVIPRKSELNVVNDTLSFYLQDEVKPILMQFYHPDYPATIKYSRANFSVFVDSQLTSELDPSNYSITNLGNGNY